MKTWCIYPDGDGRWLQYKGDKGHINHIPDVLGDGVVVNGLPTFVEGGGTAQE